MKRGFTNGHENQRDRNVSPILMEMDRRGFLTPPEGFWDEFYMALCYNFKLCTRKKDKGCRSGSR
ncbi:MAG: hypothetical protein HZA08_14285 [Nitrospirae bacterium]|nr:hypothetical protein [Nitrospirota bacterium]